MLSKHKAQGVIPLSMEISAVILKSQYSGGGGKRIEKFRVILGYTVNFEASRGYTRPCVRRTKQKPETTMTKKIL